MPDLPDLHDPAVNARLQAYYETIDDLTAQALAGQLREDEFRREMRQATEAAILLLFLMAGGDRSMSGADRAINEQIRIARNSVEQLTDDIYSGRYLAREEAMPNRPVQTAAEAREKLQNRLGLWVVTLAGMDAIGKVHARPQMVEGELKETEYTWRLGATEQHCRTCLENDGQTKTASAWRALAAVGIKPQGTGLECGGWRCDCRLERVL